MRVLHISSAEVFGGIETILVSLARHRALCPEMEHHFAVCFEGKLSEALSGFDVPLYPLGAVRLSQPFSVLRARRALVPVIKRSRCDVVVCHGPRAMVFFAPVVRASQTPLAMWVHGVKEGRHWLNGLLRRVPPDLAICCSRYTEQAFASRFPSVGSKVIHAPFATAGDGTGESARSALRRELDTPDDATVVVLASRMVPLKGHLRLIDALAELKGIESWRCWIVGGAQAREEQAYFGELQARVQTAGLAGRICFTGHRSDVPQVLAAADLYCQPNLRADSFAMVFIEAMLAGLPIITPAIGGAPEAIDCDTGILVPPDDQRALVAALRSLLTDPARCHHLGGRGPERAHQLCDPASRLHDLHMTLATLLASSSAVQSENPRTRGQR